MREKLAALENLATRGIHLKPAHLAALKGDITGYSGQQLTEHDKGGNATLYASANNQLSVLQDLSALPGFVTEDPVPILVAIENQKEEALTWWLEKANRQITKRVDQQVFLNAARYGYIEAGKWLLKQWQAILPPHDKEILLSAALRIAAAHGQLKIVKWLVDEEKAKLTDATHVELRQALIKATNQGRLNSLECLLYAGANIRNLDGSNRGKSALELAVMNDDPESMALICKMRASETLEKCRNGDTLLIKAVKAHRLRAIEWLLNNGHSIAETDDRGKSVLLLAADHVSDSDRFYKAFRTRQATVDFLITEHGANPGDGLEVAMELFMCSKVTFSSNLTLRAKVQQEAVRLKTLYDTYLKDQQQIREQIEYVLGGDSPLVPEPGVREIIQDYVANIKKIKSATEIATDLNKSTFRGISGWETIGAKKVSATFNDKHARDQAKQALESQYRDLTFSAIDTTSHTTTSSDPSTSYSLHATVQVAQASVTQPRRFSGSNSNPGFWPPAGNMEEADSSITKKEGKAELKQAEPPTDDADPDVEPTTKGSADESDSPTHR